MDFIDKIRKVIKMRHDDVVVTMTSGGVDNMEKYNYMLGQIRTYQYLLQEISTLLKTKEIAKHIQQYHLMIHLQIMRHGKET